MGPLTLFGAVAVSLMLLLYALEHRARAFVLAFAAACAASSAYGFAQGAWPFGAVEVVWTVVALRRWRQREQASSTDDVRLDRRDRPPDGRPVSSWREAPVSAW